MFFGVFFGFLTALLQDFGYIFSRRYVRDGGNPAGLLVHSQILMGGVSLLILPVLFLLDLPTSSGFLLPLILTAAGSGGGQYFFFRAERHMEPARVSSMMGLRVVLLAAATFLIFGETYNRMQIAGIALAALSAFVMNWENGRFRKKGLLEFALALGCYCLSDLSVRHMVNGFGMKSAILASVYALCLVNILTGAALLPFARGEWSGRCFAKAVPFSGAWTLKQFCLYVCYVLIGPVHANVVLAVRGPLAIVLALVMIRLHLCENEPAVSRKIWIQRTVATLMMAGAIVLYTCFSNSK